MPPYLRVSEDLRTRIEAGDLLPGEQLPSLDRLAAEYVVSRATAQRAITILASEGLIETRRRWGAFVAQRRRKSGESR
jgi:DNA-binding GntR family transcriptional regulator